MITTCLLFLWLGLAVAIGPARAVERPIVVELFTSEGCKVWVKTGHLRYDGGVIPDWHG